MDLINESKCENSQDIQSFYASIFYYFNYFVISFYTYNMLDSSKHQDDIIKRMEKVNMIRMIVFFSFFIVRLKIQYQN